MTEENVKTGLEARPLAEVDRIRDIIFGPQMRLYEKQFKRVSSQLEGLGKQLEELKAAANQQRADQDSRTHQLQDEMHERFGKLTQLETGLDQVHKELAAQTRQLTAELQKHRQELSDEFAASLDALEDGKTNRHDLGDLLMEMGTRLKGQMGIADLLGQLGDMVQEPSAE